MVHKSVKRLIPLRKKLPNFAAVKHVLMKETKIALGTWAWGTGMFGGDTVFGSNTDENNLKPVFDAAGIDTRGDWEHTME